MADLKISQLSSATALAGTEVVPVVQDGSTKKATIDQILSPAAGKGINFSANGGDVLTQYDEGTWTPTDASGAGLTFASATGKYTRIGRQVTYFAWVTYPTTASGAAAVIGGLPFVAASTNDGHGVTSYNSAGFQMFLRPNATNTITAVKNDNTTPTNANLTGALFGFQYTIFV